MSKVFRIEKNKNYTVMSNYHFRDKNISLKAKGLLSQMLSLPEDWEYSINGLAAINKEGRDGINATLKELEKNGYIVRNQLRSASGAFGNVEYVIYEEPQNVVVDSPCAENPYTIKPNTEMTDPSNTTQLNTNILNTKQLTTNLSIHHREGVMEDVGDIEDMDVVGSLAKIRNQIQYDKLCNAYGVELIDGLMSLFEDVFYTTNKTLRVGGVSKSIVQVRERFMRLEKRHIDYVLKCMKETTTPIKNYKSYVMTALYNSFDTIGLSEQRERISTDKKKKPDSNQFNNFQSREYDMSNLEALLLGYKNNKGESENE